MRSIQSHLSAVLFATFTVAMPSIAALPDLPPGLTPAQEVNVQRLILMNECAGCDLQNADLAGSHIIGADLRNANLQNVDLSSANLEGADLQGADLTGANLSGAFLTNANLADTQLVGVDFTGAHLYYVDVTGATIENPNLADAEILNTPISVGGEDGQSAPTNQLHPDDFPYEDPQLPWEDWSPALDPIL